MSLNKKWTKNDLTISHFYFLWIRDLPQKLSKFAGSGGTGESEIIKTFFFLNNANK